MSTRPLAILLVLVGCTTSRLPEPGPLLFERLDADGSGRLDGMEVGSLSDPDRQAIDEDGSGDIDATELDRFLARPPHSVLRMRAAQRGKARRFKRPPPARPPGEGPPPSAHPPPPEGRDHQPQPPGTEDPPPRP